MYVRAGISKKPELLLESLENKSTELSVTVKDPFSLEFLGLDAKDIVSESDLEQAIMDHLQEFLLEMGKMAERPTFDNISMIGRLAYLFMCIERYLVNKYPDRDWTVVADRLWNWTEEYWNDAQEKSDQIIPEYVLAFKSYEKVNKKCFDGELPEDLYNQMVKLYTDITTGDSEDEINQVLFTTVEWGTYCEGASLREAIAPATNLIEYMLDILDKYEIEYPDVSSIQHMSIDEKNGWGEFCNCRHLSIILN